MRLLRNLAMRTMPVRYLRRRGAPGPGTAGAGERQLLVDVSLISRADDGTGIQRVVRNLRRQLVEAPPPGLRVRPVAATRQRGYRYLSPEGEPAGDVQVARGDVFLGLDLAAGIVTARADEIQGWKRRGVRLVFFVYDLLPVQQPRWFNPRTAGDFRRWLRTLAVLADEVVCISRTVERDFFHWLQESHGLAREDMRSSVIELGSDPFGFATQGAATSSATALPPALCEGKFVLMVGTLEPRKAHGEVLDAFERLWAEGDTTGLVIAGRRGWMVEDLVRRLHGHAEAGKRLHWLEAPADALLMELYQRAAGVLMASKGEGLGLPILEAQCWNKPVLVRDIPIFREIAGSAATFFPGAPPEGLFESLRAWVPTLDAARRDVPIGPAVSWRSTRDQLVRVLPSGGAAPPP